MNISSITPGGAASAVWNAVTRTLTGFGSNALKALSGIPGAIPANTTVGLTPPAGQFWNMTITVSAGAAGSVEIYIDNAGTHQTLLLVTAGNTGGVTVFADPSVGISIKNNDAVNTAGLKVAGYAMAQ